jgi:DNA-directed RNA polymerase specialized sigma24 family protein
MLPASIPVAPTMNSQMPTTLADLVERSSADCAARDVVRDSVVDEADMGLAFPTDRRANHDPITDPTSSRTGGGMLGTVTSVLDAVGKLTARQRGVVYLTYWLDRSASEVADELDVSVRTAERELTHARRELEVLLR